MVYLHAHDIRLEYPLPSGFRLRRGESHSRIGGSFSTHGRTGGSLTALDGVSFDLEAGDRLGLVGVNGAGKTTLLKTLYGIYEPTSGWIDKRGSIDALFNINLGFRREATGRRNIVLRGLINGWSRKHIESRMDEIIDFSELDDFIDMPMKTYSAGMSTRLAFAIATSFHPEILLMDEWIGAGDQTFQDKAKARMDDVVDKAGIIVIASHNQTLINRLCNKILVLEKGRMKSFDRVSAVR